MKHEILWYPENGFIKDNHGRTRFFRGINFGGIKNPAPVEDNDAGGISFTDRPFPESEADELFRRLSDAGFNLIRWGITWEAVEHDGPECYDEDFLAYTRRMLKKAEEYNISVILQPYQNAWCRLTGGCGAPLWTLDKVGFNRSMLEACSAVYTKEAAAKDGYQSYPWQLNYQRYVCQTMFTLFFAGNTFAPECRIEGISAQDYLQEHYIAAMYHVARRLKDCSNIIGMGIMNEPSGGYIGISDLDNYIEPPVPEGVLCTPFSGMKAASGIVSSFNHFELKHSGLSIKKSLVVNDKRNTGEKAIEKCPWREAGVWHEEDGKAVLDRPDYFYMRKGSPVDFTEDYLRPFQQIFMEALQKKHPEYIFFTECNPAGVTDGFTIAGIFSCYDSRINAYRKTKTEWLESLSQQMMDKAEAFSSEGIPAVMGDFGVPMNMMHGSKESMLDYSRQEEVFTAYMETAEKELLSTVLSEFSLPGFEKDASCMADFNVYNASLKQFRAEKGFSRPYPVAVAGKPVSLVFHTDGIPMMEFEWDCAACPADSDETDTEFFIPDVWFPYGWHA
ncbi:MAG: cellulase family glycosylhydrolase, partial [Treponemataceae bacterium]|nr:cellulase family glycosylhydrolase [Treponemataceae bacterium]